MILFGLAALAIIVVADGLLTPPGEHWYEKRIAASRTVDDRKLVVSEPALDDAARMDKIRSAARASWELAEWYYSRGEWEKARDEYQRLISDFPYVELDYGYRTDDARNRLAEVTKIIDEERATGPRGIPERNR